jgi:NADH-quinone oxidoreductase subunit J
MLGITPEDGLFHIFAALATLGALLVVFVKNPIYSALFLALTMSVLGAVFFTLEAYFVAVAQITVYAGAVMVLFVMVLMLFDLKHEHEDILRVTPLNLSKILAVAIMCGFLVGTAWLAVSAVNGNLGAVVAPQTAAVDLEKKELPIAKDAAKETPKEPLKAPTNPDEDLTAAESAALVDNKIDEVVLPEPNITAPVPNAEFGSTVSLSRRLFSNYVFAFEAVSLLLLVAIVGAVALAKSRGGTHHAS